MSGALGLNQLGRDAHPLTRLAYAAFKQVSDAEFATHLPQVHSLAFVNKAGIPRDSEQPFDARKPCDNVLNHTVGEILLFRIAAKIVERQKSSAVGEPTF